MPLLDSSAGCQRAFRTTSSPASEAKSAPIIVVSYDSSWPGTFEAERQVLARTLAPWLAGPIEHVGSTAAPGLEAKPVIDTMVAVKSLDASRSAIPAAETVGHIYWPYKADIMHWFFCKPVDSGTAGSSHGQRVVLWPKKE